MVVIACVVVALLLGAALVVCRIRLARERSRRRAGDPVDYGAIPGTQMFDADFVAVAPSDERVAPAVDDDEAAADQAAG